MITMLSQSNNTLQLVRKLHPLGMCQRSPEDKNPGSGLGFELLAVRILPGAFFLRSDSRDFDNRAKKNSNKIPQTIKPPKTYHPVVLGCVRRRPQNGDLQFVCQF